MSRLVGTLFPNPGDSDIRGANSHQAILGQATQDADRNVSNASCHNTAPDVAIDRGTLAIENRFRTVIHLSPIDNRRRWRWYGKSRESGKEPVQFISGVHKAALASPFDRTRRLRHAGDKIRRRPGLVMLFLTGKPHRVRRQYQQNITRRTRVSCFHW